MMKRMPGGYSSLSPSIQHAWYVSDLVRRLQGLGWRIARATRWLCGRLECARTLRTDMIII